MLHIFFRMSVQARSCVRITQNLLISSTLIVYSFECDCIMPYDIYIVRLFHSLSSRGFALLRAQFESVESSRSAPIVTKVCHPRYIAETQKKKQLKSSTSIHERHLFGRFTRKYNTSRGAIISESEWLRSLPVSTRSLSGQKNPKRHFWIRARNLPITSQEP